MINTTSISDTGTVEVVQIRTDAAVALEQANPDHDRLFQTWSAKQGFKHPHDTGYFG